MRISDVITERPSSQPVTGYKLVITERL